MHIACNGTIANNSLQYHHSTLCRCSSLISIYYYSSHLLWHDVTHISFNLQTLYSFRLNHATLQCTGTCYYHIYPLYYPAEYLLLGDTGVILLCILLLLSLLFYTSIFCLCIRFGLDLHHTCTILYFLIYLMPECPSVRFTI